MGSSRSSTISPNQQPRRSKNEMAYRLRGRKPLTLQEREERARRRQQSRWNGNGLGATNDSEEFKASVRIVDGYPIEYSCLHDPRQKPYHQQQQQRYDDDTVIANTNNTPEIVNTTSLYIAFDYEMVTVKNADVLDSVRSLEWSLLWNVARNMGLHSCNYQKQQVGRRLAAGSYVVGLSSLELDDVDQNTAQCTMLTSPDEGVVCTPMIGRMTATFTGDRDAIDEYLAYNIMKEMNSKRVRIEQVKECRYIGDRSKLPVFSNAQDGLTWDNTTMNLTLAAGVFAGVVVLFMALLMARGRRRRRQQQQPQPQQLVLDDDGAMANNPSVIFRKPPAGQRIDSMRHSCSGDTQESLTESNIVAAEDEEVDYQHQADSTVYQTSHIAPMASINIRHDEDPLTDEVPQLPASTSEALEVTSEDDEDSRETSIVAASSSLDDKENMGVPPRPPLCVIPLDDDKSKDSAAKSKTLQPKRKRRRKKKKKQPVLQRTSSRNSFDEMETIQEDDESYDAEGSEFEGSEYSTDDEDDPLGLCMDSNDASDGAQDTLVPPSPIREEPKIRPLPPPWI